MSEQQQIRDAIQDIDSALKEHKIYPAYDDKEMEQIIALRDSLRERLQLLQEEK